MIVRKSVAAWLALATVGVSIVAPQVRAGGDKVAFPENYAEGVIYTTVDRAVSAKPPTAGLENTAQFREHYVTAAALEAMRKGEPTPSGTVMAMVKYRAKLDAHGQPVKDADGRFIKADLIGFSVMEKRTGWGAKYPADIRNGEWEYQDFTADKRANAKVDLAVCFQCHKPQSHNDFLFTIDKIKAAAAKIGRMPN
jgi:hypothetical protein